MEETTLPSVDLEKQLKALRKENRRLERTLEVTTSQLRFTDELYRTSESVLKKAYSDLEQTEHHKTNMQMELERTTKMAAVGAMAAMVVHEVLNPMTSLLGRLQAMIRQYESGPSSNPLEMLKEIIEEWQRLNDEKGFLEYCQTPGEDGLTLLQEDLEDSQTIVDAMQKSRVQLQEDLRFLERTCLHMVKIINSMRALSRTKADVAPTSLNTVLVDTIELLHLSLKKSHIVVRQRYARDLPEVNVDSNEMVQVFTNIIRNAQQAMGKNGEVEVETRCNGERVEVRVKDTGPGIPLPADKVDLIFEGGYTTKPRDEGTGLGLSICRQYVRKYLGDVIVERTAPGEGTTFLVWLPVRAEGGDARTTGEWTTAAEGTSRKAG